MKTALILVLAIILAVLSYFFFQKQLPETNKTNMNLTLKSSAFNENGLIPAKHTCDGENINPMLEIKNVPAGTKSLVLIIDDPNATGGITWDHWIVYNIKPDTQYIEEDTIPDNALQGKNSFGKENYGGPCPPHGSKPHRYMFKLYALDINLSNAPDLTKSEIEKIIEGHILERTTLTGLYQRK